MERTKVLMNVQHATGWNIASVDAYASHITEACTEVRDRHSTRLIDVSDKDGILTGS
jgi:hypothetical protein